MFTRYHAKEEAPLATEAREESATPPRPTGYRTPEMGPRYEAVLPPILGLAGYLLGWFILTVAGDRSPASKQFMLLPEFAVWRALTAGELGLWLAILPHAFVWRRQMHDRCELVPGLPLWVECVVAFVFVALVVIPLSTTRSNIQSPLAYNTVRI